MSAAMGGHLTVVQYLLDRGAEVNAKTYDSQTPLIQAAASGHLAVVQCLLEKGAEVSVKDSSGQTPVRKAAYQGHLAVVQCLLERGAEVNAQDLSDWFMRACESGQLAMTQYLLDRGAEVNVKDSSGQTPVRQAVYRGHLTVVQCLLDRGAEVNAQDLNDWFMRACESGQLAMTQYLLARGAEVNVQDSSGQTPLMWAIQGGHVELAQDLLARGAEVNVQDSSGQTPLMRAIQGGHVELAQDLLARGAESDAKDAYAQMLSSLRTREHPMSKMEEYRLGVQYDKGEGVLQNYTHAKVWYEKAALAGCGEAQAKLGCLYDAGLGVERDEAQATLWWGKLAARSHYGPDKQPLLHWAVAENLLALVAFLLQKDASNINKQNRNKLRPLDLVGYGHPEYPDYPDAYPEMVRLLVAHGADVDAPDDDEYFQATRLHHAIGSPRSGDLVKFWIAQGASAHVCTIQGKTPLHIAVGRDCDYDAAEALLAADNTTVNGCSAAEDGVAALRIAVQAGHLRLVRLLLAHGADPNMRNSENATIVYQHPKNSVTSLHEAVEQATAEDEDSVNIVRALVEYGADVQARDGECEEGLTPLELAVTQDKVEILRALLAGFADLPAFLNQVSEASPSLLYKAAEGGDLNTVQYLVESGANIHTRNGVGTNWSLPKPRHRGDGIDKRGATPLFGAFAQGHLALAQFLIARGADIHALDTEGKTLLHMAVLQGSLENVGFLVSQNVNVNACTGAGRTPLHMAASKGDLTTVRFLIAAGADLHARDEKGVTPLDDLFNTCHCLETARFLVDQGIHINARTPKGETLLHMAANRVDYEMARFLMEAGADVYAGDEKGVTPLDCIGRLLYVSQEQSQSFKDFLIKGGLKQKFLHFAFGRHPRLGQESAVQLFVDDVIGLVHSFVMDPDEQSVEQPRLSQRP